LLNPFGSVDGDGGSASAKGLGAPSTDNQSLRTICFLVFSPSLVINGTRGIELQGVLCVETIAANSPSLIPSSADLGVALWLPWCAILKKLIFDKISPDCCSFSNHPLQLPSCASPAKSQGWL